MYKNRITTLHVPLDNCIASISFALCRKLPIEEIFVSVVCQKKHQCDDSHIGFRTVSAYYDSLVDFFTQVLYLCPGDEKLQIVFWTVQFFHPINQRVKKSDYFQSSRISLIINPKTFPSKVMIELSQCYIFQKFSRYQALNAILRFSCSWTRDLQLMWILTDIWLESWILADVTRDWYLRLFMTYSLTSLMTYSWRDSGLIPDLIHVFQLM